MLPGALTDIISLYVHGTLRESADFKLPNPILLNTLKGGILAITFYIIKVLLTWIVNIMGRLRPRGYRSL